VTGTRFGSELEAAARLPGGTRLLATNANSLVARADAG
jgi:hypothetical protein